MIPIVLTWFLALVLFVVWGLAIAWPTDDEASFSRWQREQDAWRDTFR